MKKLGIVLMLLTFAGLVFAPVIRGMILIPTGKDKTVIVAKDEVIDDDLFISGDEVIFEGTVNGDLYAVGGVVTIRGTVNGDVLAAGGNIEISGEIADDVRVAGGNIRIDEATIGDSVSVVGGNISIDDETTIGGGLVFAGGSIVSRADVGRGIVGGGGSVTLEGVVVKDAHVGGEMLTLGSGAQVGGDLIYTSEREPRLVGEATVSGQIREFKPEGLRIAQGIDREEVERFGRGIFRGMQAGFRVWSYVAALLVGVVMLATIPKHSRGVVETLEKRFLGSLGWGFVVFILAGPALLLALMTVVGIPLALIFGALYLIDLYVAKLFVGMALGRWLKKVLNQKWSKYLSFILGLAAFYVLSALPVVGFIVGVVGRLTGLGALFGYKKELWAKR